MNEKVIYICPICQKEVSASDNVCPHCGTEFEPISTEVKTSNDIVQNVENKLDKLEIPAEKISQKTTTEGTSKETKNLVEISGTEEKLKKSTSNFQEYLDKEPISKEEKIQYWKKLAENSSVIARINKKKGNMEKYQMYLERKNFALAKLEETKSVI